MMIVDPITTLTIPLDEMKGYLKLDDYTDDDALIVELLKAAEEHIEKICNRLINKRQVKELYGVIGSTIKLKYRASKVDIKMDGVSIDESIYDVVTDNDGCTTVCLGIGQQWPVYEIKHNGIELLYDAGYEYVPGPIKLTIRKLVHSWYDNRMNGRQQYPTELRHLLTRYIRF